MIVQYWQIVAAMQAAKAANPKSLVGSRINYQFCHEIAPGVDKGVCGLFGWVLEHRNPDASEGEPMDLVLALDTTIDEFFVTEAVQARFAREQLAADTTINQADRATEIDNIVLGPER